MKIAICEDQLVQINVLNTKIKKWANENNIEISIDNFTTAESFLFEWVDYDKYDWSYVNILDTKSQTFLCCTSS